MKTVCDRDYCLFSTLGWSANTTSIAIIYFSFLPVEVPKFLAFCATLKVGVRDAYNAMLETGSGGEVGGKTHMCVCV